MKLLLAEDDRVVRITVRDALEEAGYQVTACPDGFSALREAESEPFDLVLTDGRNRHHLVLFLVLFGAMRDFRKGLSGDERESGPADKKLGA